MAKLKLTVEPSSTSLKLIDKKVTVSLKTPTPEDITTPFGLS